MKKPLTQRQRLYLKYKFGLEQNLVSLDDIGSRDIIYDLYSKDVLLSNSDYPLDYIIGEIFIPELNILISVKEGVLLPRTETIHWLQELLKRQLPDKSDVIIDVGTGTGLIGIAYAKNGYTVVTTDLFQAPLELAEYNRRINNIQTMPILQSDVLSSSKLIEIIGDTSWSIVSNLPYVPRSDMQQPTFQSIRYEPEEAIFAGVDGLDLVRTMATQIAGLKNKPNSIILELDPRNINFATTLFPDYQAEILNDYNGFNRLLVLKVDKLG